MELYTYYRLSSKDAFLPKDKLPYNKHACLLNLINEFGTDSLIIQADNCSDDVIYQLEALKVNYYITHCSSSSESFITLLSKIKELGDDELVYVVEDDYLHKPGAKKILMEGLSTGADYVSLYDHPDKYIDAANGGNPYIEGGGEVTKVLLTKTCHWKYTNSTCLTFATTAKCIKEDFEIWKWAVFDNPSLGSFQAFITLRDKSSRVLISSIPGYATHIEVAWLSPLTDWNKI